MANLQFMSDIACAEYASGKANERVQHDKDDVQIIDEDERSRRWLVDEQRQCGEQRQESSRHVETGREAIARQDREKGGSQHRYHEQEGDAVEGEGCHPCHPPNRSPRSLSRASRSTVSKRSRMRNRKMPITMKAMRTEKATLISTTSGMPLAPAAARIRPFSSDMKPITWLTALPRVTIIRSPSSTTDRAKARSSRASASASEVTRSMSTMDSATSDIPASIVGPMPTTVSTSR